MSQTRFRVVGMGDLVTDINAVIQTFPIEPGECQNISTFQAQPGGMGNLLIAGARLGMEMIAIGVMGADRYSREILDAFTAENIDVSNIHLMEGSPSKIVLALSTENGSHVFLPYQGGDIPAQPLHPQWREALAACDAFHVEGFALTEPFMEGAILEAMSISRQKGGLVFFDPGPRLQSTRVEILTQTLKNTDYLILTGDELDGLVQRLNINHWAELMEYGLKGICIKKGMDGCQIFDGEVVTDCPGIQVEAVDVTGAGDAFAAAFIFGILSQWDLKMTGSFANVMGAAKVRKIGGGRNVPTRSELIELYRENNLSFPGF